ncbi:DNA mismatch repair protein [Bacillus sp. AFS076308]|uniref:endonuclease MutS2 n=1 Tax=unclassified Bacillus (in: firmicutes) TaxID=185979 RepID=UPI000BF5E4F5|nr:MULTISPECIES: DNA mismatch repair protein [unclassified Bacillus (in: firmicutes)]PFO04807.1 DNA mismatch repair protein [Bacillus sp. AFS076308]PGV49751.1 DNA mismatch repair protein [Bacillus sp. AFS037270]
MNQHTFNMLEFQQIKDEIANFALTKEGKEKIKNLVPSTKVKQIEAWLEEVTEAVEILKISASVPVHGLDGMTAILQNMNKGAALRVEQLTKLYDFLDSCGKMRRYMKDKAFYAPRVSAYVEVIDELPELAAEIIRCVRNGRVDDYASKELLKIRKQLAIQEERLKEKTMQLIRSNNNKLYLQENVVSQRNGRYVIPIKKEYRNKIKGTVLDTSASGSTLFIEPEEIAVFQDQLTWLLSDEEVEVQKVLTYLTGLVEQKEQQICLAVETMIQYDFLFAKAKYCRMIKGSKVGINQFEELTLIQARHPLLGDKAVPLTFTMSREEKALVITGPNTGGKTVTIKTVGLLTLMVQSGLHIPAAEESNIRIFDRILVDIGDGQSITENLSTFSSRIVNIIEILKDTNDRTLALLDELGSGTDPGEGMGLATAILETLYQKGATILATTHYSEIKEFAEEHLGFINGSMEFDLTTLSPTYRLVIGRGGDSQAFAIALRLGMHPAIVERAHYITYKEEKQYLSQETEQWKLKELEKQVMINKYQQQQAAVKTEIPIYHQGDNVKISPANEFGIVYKGPDQHGNYLVQVKGEKVSINHKRLTIYIRADELYPENYDFDIIFQSKENRKKSKLLSKGYQENITIDYSE